MSYFPTVENGGLPAWPQDGFEANRGGIENPDFEDGEPWEPPAQLVEDLAAACGTTPERAVEAIRAAMLPAPPLVTVGFVVDYRWYERPRRLWRQRATLRTARENFLAAVAADPHPRPVP